MSKGFNTQKLFKYVRLAAWVGPAVGVAIGSGTPANKAKVIMSMYTGYHPDTGNWDYRRMIPAYLPGIATTAITAIVPKISSFIKGVMK